MNHVREDIEWCNFRWDHAPDTTLPRVLLIGDSIVVGYREVVSGRLEGVANVDMLATSKCITDPALVRETRFVMEEYEHAVIHFNNGLHGKHLSDEQYEAGLREYVRTLRQLSNARLVWASSTPVAKAGDPAALHEERNPQVLSRNRIAAEIMKEHGIPVHDLYGLVVGRPELRVGGADLAHYNADGQAVQGEAVAKTILGILEGDR